VLIEFRRVRPAHLTWAGIATLNCRASEGKAGDGCRVENFATGAASSIDATHARQLTQIIRGDARRWAVLAQVRALGLPDCWVAAGFVRDAVWDHLHGYAPQLLGDVDVIWFDRARAGGQTR
jgi:Nucleotidyltransferase